MKKEIYIPFDGFYCSLTDAMIDDELDMLLEVKELDSIDNLDYSVDKQYIAKEYVIAYKQWLDDNGYPCPNSLEFKELDSPRFYNYRTDRILCTVDYSDLQAIYDHYQDDKQELKSHIEKCLSSRSGFISFYDDFVANWQNTPLDEWDCNELGMLLPEPDYCELWESPMSNGAFNQAIIVKEGV